MKAFIFRRFLQVPLVLFVITTLIFFASRGLTDPAVTLLPDNAVKGEYERIRRDLGLDKPVYQQYFIYMGDLARGDLGDSIRKTGYKVTDLIWKPLANSAKLAGAAFLLAVGIGIPLGILSALNRGSWPDVLARLVAVLGLVTPGWWLGMVLIFIFSVSFNLLPAAGPGGIKHYILPASVLGAHAMAGIARMVRSTMLDVLDSEYVKLARAKGLTRGAIVWKHALRNALIPTVTLAGLYFAQLVTGAITIEVVFAWPGMGRLMFDSLNSQDYVVVQGTVMTAAFIVVMFNFVVDIAYGVIDPRIRYR